MQVVNTAENLHDDGLDYVPNRVMVYGTLKRGRGNHHLMREAEFKGRCIVSGLWSLYDLGGFPAVVLRTEGDNSYVLGEVYEVNEDTFRTLDMLEGHPDWYRRIRVATPFGTSWMYTFRPGAELHRTWRKCDTVWQPSSDEREWLKGGVAESAKGA